MLRIIVSKFLTRVAREEDGITAVEYAVLGALIVAALSAVVGGFTTELTTAFTDIIKP
ncbi:pilus assembly protein Flp/PilA [Inquilinus ginsengisoli]|uniref:Flp family type IVb pilin n=1 Tax=Inquilinus ginsengisoli TaxID=363840 RepID=UPI003D2567FB